MPALVIPNTIRTVMNYVQNGQVRNNVFHFKKAGFVPVLADLNAINSWMNSTWNSFMKQGAPTTLGLDSIQSTSLHVANGIQSTLDNATPVFGTSIGSVAPFNATTSVSLRTGLSGKSYRGRFYWPGLADVVTNDDSTLTNAMMVLLGTVLGELIFGSHPAGIVLAVASRAGLFSTPVTSGIVEGILDSQRRRLPGRGR